MSKKYGYTYNTIIVIDIWNEDCLLHKVKFVVNNAQFHEFVAGVDMMVMNKSGIPNWIHGSLLVDRKYGA